MSLSLTQQLERILAFLYGVRNPRVFSLMSMRGFSQADLAEGWSLFSEAAGARLTYTPTPASPLSPDEARSLIDRLDEIENIWFPVVAATLKRRFPALHEQVFLNLAQTSGPEVLISVGTLLNRVEALAETEEGAKAGALLAQRGFTPELRAEARALIEQVQTAGHAAIPEIDPASADRQKQALADAWAWYKEWGAIARTVIHRGDVLVRLGLRRPAQRPQKVEDGVEGEGELAGPLEA